MADAPKTLQVRPVSLAMVVADRAYRDPATGKCTIFGIFSHLHLAQVPGGLPTMAVYCLLSDGRGSMPFSLDLIEAADPSEISLLSAAGTLNFKLPREVLECLFEFQNVHFPREGEYRLRLHWRAMW